MRCFSATSAFMLLLMKLIRNEGESMFLIANWASVGMCGLCLMISSARSFSELTSASNSLSFLSGRSSLNSWIRAVK